MPTAHVCPCCGNQLALNRAVPDAVYGLPIVQCDCGHVVVRRRHPVTIHSRRILPVAEASIRLVLQLIVLFLLSVGVAAFTYRLANEIRDLRLKPVSFVKAMLFQSPDHERLMRNWFIGEGGFWFLVAFAIASFVAGIWVRAGLAHWRWPRPLLAWIAVISAIIWIEVVLWPLTWMLRKITGDSTRYDGLTFWQSLEVAQVLAVSIVITLLGTTVGFGLSRIAVGFERRRFIKRLAKLRKRRRAE